MVVCLATSSVWVNSGISTCVSIVGFLDNLGAVTSAGGASGCGNSSTTSLTGGAVSTLASSAIGGGTDCCLGDVGSSGRGTSSNLPPKGSSPILNSSDCVGADSASTSTSATSNSRSGDCTDGSTESTSSSCSINGSAIGISGSILASTSTGSISVGSRINSSRVFTSLRGNSELEETSLAILGVVRILSRRFCSIAAAARSFCCLT